MGYEATKIYMHIWEYKWNPVLSHFWLFQKWRRGSTIQLFPCNSDMQVATQLHHAGCCHTTYDCYLAAHFMQVATQPHHAGCCHTTFDCCLAALSCRLPCRYAHTAVITLINVTEHENTTTLHHYNGNYTTAGSTIFTNPLKMEDNYMRACGHALLINSIQTCVRSLPHVSLFCACSLFNNVLYWSSWWIALTHFALLSGSVGNL